MTEDPAAGGGAERPIVLAAVAGAHGVKGEIRLKLFAENINSLKRYKQVQVGDKTLSLKSIRAGNTVVATFAEITDRSAAEALRGSLVTVSRSTLPPLDPGEYYFADLLGLACVSASGAEIGRVVAVENFGAGDIIEIEHPDGSLAMVPFQPGIADLQGDRIVIDAEFLS